MIFIYSTFSDKAEAKKIGLALVRKKLAACINMFPVESIYRWRGGVEHEKEYAMIIKTRKQNFKKVESFILKHHSYDTPCIIEIPSGRITKKYLKWLLTI